MDFYKSDEKKAMVWKNLETNHDLIFKVSKMLDDMHNKKLIDTLETFIISDRNIIKQRTGFIKQRPAFITEWPGFIKQRHSFIKKNLFFYNNNKDLVL